MISTQCFSREWIQSKKEEIGVADPGILEKSIHALALLGHLAESGLNFVFKGGTSLLLHLSPIRRLSTDIDIVCGATKEELDNKLSEISTKPPFIRFQEDERGHRGLPQRRHFRFYYTPIEGGHQAPHVLLDVVEESECNLPITNKPIITDFLEIEREVMVSIPTIEGLLADKLTAFAPNTIGVPFKDRNDIPQSMQVAKQLFDIGELFNEAQDLNIIIKTYQTSFDIENKYRGGKYKNDQAIQDTVDTCYQFCGQRLRKFPILEDTKNLSDGVKTLHGHLVNHQFRIDLEAKTAAAKAAFLVKAIQNGKTDINPSEILYSETKQEEIKSAKLAEKYSPLSRLKKTNPEAFYYWFTLQRLCGD